MADEESAEARKRLDAALLNFRSGQLNCLVSTQVLEEGMDVKRCNLVVRFDRIQTFRSYVQAGYYYITVICGYSDTFQTGLNCFRT